MTQTNQHFQMNCKHANMEHNKSFGSLFAQHLTSHSYQSPFIAPGSLSILSSEQKSSTRPITDRISISVSGSGCKNCNVIWTKRFGPSVSVFLFACTLTFVHYPFFLLTQISLCCTIRCICTRFPAVEYENGVWICMPKKQGYCLWWTAMHNAAFFLIYIHSNTHTRTRVCASTHQDSYPQTRRETGL